jgi:mannose-6-phosphate isomerase-like protein (cupin superfamily)
VKLKNVTPKPWGHEVILAKNDKYVVKQLFVKAGHRLSLQYHRQKIEHITLVDGKAHMFLEYDDGITQFKMERMDPVPIDAGVIHRLSADSEEDALLVEVSTPELDDVERLEDDYGRGPEKKEDDDEEPQFLDIKDDE